MIVTAKLVPVGYGIKKLQIMLSIVDDLVSVDSLIEEHLTVEPVNEYVQSCDIVAFNKICKYRFKLFPVLMNLFTARFCPIVHMGRSCIFSEHWNLSFLSAILSAELIGCILAVLVLGRLHSWRDWRHLFVAILSTYFDSQKTYSIFRLFNCLSGGVWFLGSKKCLTPCFWFE